MEYEAVIGLEVHAQVLSRSKMFCGCSADYSSAPPNTHVCPVCLGMPGVLPVMNRRGVEATIMTGLALHCAIPEHSKFDRKNYHYPDLMKGYQISQYDMPFCTDGWLEIEGPDGPRRAGITRVHLEEDTARLSHRTEGGERFTLVDVNRSGVPLMEIVGEPDLRTPDEAGSYLTNLRQVLEYLGVSTARMDEGAMRCDANVSLRPKGQEAFGAKVEVKNMNSIRSVVRALEYEIVRQTALLEKGERPVQETRGWVEDRGITVSQRSKEDAHDYRYFPEPDLPPVVVTREWLEEIRARLPELPDARRLRLATEYGLSEYDARLLSAERPLADLFEATVAMGPADGEARQKRAKAVANWLLGEYLRILKEQAGEEEAAGGPARIQPAQLSGLLDLLDAGTINQPVAKQVFATVFGTDRDPAAVVEAEGLAQVQGGDEMAGFVAEVLADPACAKAIADYRSGKESALQFLVGQLMRRSRGRARPDTARALLEDALKAAAP